MWQNPSNPRTQTLTQQYFRLFDSYLRFGEELSGRSWSLVSGGLRRAIGQLERGSLGRRSSGHVLQSLLDGYLNCVSEIAMAWPLAAETASLRISRSPQMPHEGVTVRDGQGPPIRGEMHEVPGDGAGGRSRPLALPVRFIDASQAWAAFVVPVRVASEVLGAHVDTVTPFDVGGGRTLATIMGIDYRVCDLGHYQEIAVALIVTARNNPAAVPGATFVGIGVNGEFSGDAARSIWGLEKVFNNDLSVTYRPDSVAFGLKSGHPETLSIRFPRFGTRRFDRLPILIHSLRGRSDGKPAEPLQSLMSLSGHGGGVQVGGSVSIRLGSVARSACICQGSSEDCVCNCLRELDIADRLPAANGWTEHLSGTFEAPHAPRPATK